MTPNFALILDHDGISLLYRQGSDWRSLGSVSLEAADFDAKLDLLRQQAEVLSDGAALRSTLVLPNSQILYASTEAGKDARENARLAGRRLEGATPYALDELVYDWKARGDEILIAAVARDTLEEAEGFAQLHGFGPLSFTAAPEDGSFPGAPFFGPSDAAPRLLAPGEVLERIARPILSSGPYVEPKPAPEPEPEPESLPVETTDESFASSELEPEAVPAPEPEAADIAEKPVPTPEPAAAEDAKKNAPEPTPEPATAEAPAVGFVSLRSSLESPESKAAETPVAPMPPASEPPLEAKQPEPRVDAEDGKASDTPPPAAFSSIRSRVEPPVTAPSGGKSKNLGSTPKNAARTAPPPAKASDKTARKRTEPVLKAAPKPTSASPASDGARRSLHTDKAAHDATANAPGGEAGEQPGFRVPPAPPPLNEAEALTVFGARKSQQPQQSPSRLALIAAVGGAFVVGLIGLWALLGSGEEDFTATDSPSELVTEAPSAPQLVSPETAALPELAPSDSAPAAIALAPATEAPASETGLATPDMAGTAETPAQVSGAAALAPLADDAAPEDLRQPAIQNEASTVGITQQEDTLASLSTSQQPLGSVAPSQSGDTLAESLPEDSVAAPMVVDPTPLDPVSALAAYTVSGIWQRAPERTQQALEGETEEYYIASIDPTVPSQDAYALPTLDRAPDVPPQAAVTPVVPEPEVEPAQASDAQDGAEVAPGGVEIVLGKPSIVPPRRPADLAPDIQAAPETGGNPAENTLRGERPRTRPGGLIEANERATFGGNTRSELAQIRPNTRPRSLQETAEALDDAARMADAETVDGQLGVGAQSFQDQALALDLASATRRAVANSPQPRLRPSNISQIADRARKRTEQEAQAQAEAEEQAREDAQAAALSQERAVAATARRAAQEAAAQEAAKQAAAAQAAKEKEAAIQAAAKAAREEEREASARSSGPAVARNERANPTGKTSATVAKAATVKNQISLSKVALIGVYGTSTKRRALVRLPSGKMVKVKVGDRIDGGRVAAIGTSDLRYQKGSRTVTLKMPKG
ncbi:hypothetical protein [Aliiruegeria sabulilitoris]|uniref:hypothetical protein n=1 Tax=Aliiruegeria sabulilitoris TaxID=1510458 RepID=UPI00082BB643|nr:hypothetical protein [Aliiruegeria sabulilitoris]NDR56089.1 hypothetical protein [Pseudoruegeria sp. M32A2M]